MTEEPSVTVREVSGADGSEEKYLGSLFYNADTKKLTITPEKTGTGIIRIADLKQVCLPIWHSLSTQRVSTS